jgi:TPR repeat protein
MTWRMRAAIIIALVAGGCERSTSPARPEAKAVSTTDVPAFVAELDSPERRQKLVRLAEGGDAGAARRLADYYAMNGDDDDAEQEKWLIKAVELGDSTARLNYGVFLYHRGGSGNCAKAKAMIERYARERPDDPEYAEGWLQQIERDATHRCAR